MGECGLLAGVPLTGPSRPFGDGSSLGLLVALGFMFPLTTVGMELLAGGEGAFALTGGSGVRRGQPEKKGVLDY